MDKLLLKLTYLTCVSVWISILCWILYFIFRIGLLILIDVFFHTFCEFLLQKSNDHIFNKLCLAGFNKFERLAKNSIFSTYPEISHDFTTSRNVSELLSISIADSSTIYNV